MTTYSTSFIVTSPLPADFESATSMGQSQSKPKSRLSSFSCPRPSTSSHQRDSTWRETWKDTLASFGITTSIQAVPTDNIFVPIAADSILPQIPIGRHHPVPRKGIEDDEDQTLHPNKFYANAFLGSQDQPIWTHPYSIWWGNGHGEDGQYPTWGMCIGHVEADKISYDEEKPPKSYTNAQRRQSLIMSAQELDSSTTLTTDTHLPFSVNINLNHHSAAWEPKMTIPVVQGMSFITGGYRNATPSILCPGNGFKGIVGPFRVGRSTKYRITDDDGYSWIMYVNPVPGIDYDARLFQPIDQHTFVGPSNFKGTIQIAKNPLHEDCEALYDKATGAFVAEATLTGTVTDTRGTYTLSYTKVGSSPILMFVLPHHLQSLDPTSTYKITKLQLRTTTKGMATAVWAEALSFLEPNLPTTMCYSPWIPGLNPAQQRTRFSVPTMDVLMAAADKDLRTMLSEKVPNDSMYYAGKTFAKWATLCYVMRETLAHAGFPSALDHLKTEFAKYVDNRQRYPLYYDDSWKGLVSNAGFSDPGADFGNTYYNDHHFHYGYFVYAASVIATLEPGWLSVGDSKQWVNSLVKDYAESDYTGRDYPFSRNFDWWHGHSWAKGLFESADGKDEESTSEDGFASYAIKMWGKAIGDVNMEKRGNLMLAIQARSFSNYFYLQSNNTNQPTKFIHNKVTGILFENKVDHATYFGTAPPLVHGIHMLPLSPASAYLRPKPFVREEWDRFFTPSSSAPGSGSGSAVALAPADKVTSSWRGILMSNLALIEARESWEFFRDGVKGVWDDGWIDGGTSRLWYLCFAAGLGGAR